MIRLSTSQRRVLAAIQLNASSSVTTISKQTQLREHTVRYIMKGFEHSGVIQKRPMTDVHAIGLTQYSIFCTPCFDSEQSQRRLLKHLIESPVQFVARYIERAPLSLEKFSIPDFAEATSGHCRRREGPAKASMATAGKTTSSPIPPKTVQLTPVPP
jgi:hypothetical protein